MKLFYKKIHRLLHKLFLNASIECLRESELTEHDKDYYYYIDYYPGVPAPMGSLETLCRNFIKSNYESDPTYAALVNESVITLGIPDIVRRALNSGHARLIIDTSVEGHIDEGMYHIHKILNVSEEQIIWIAGERLTKNKIQNFNRKYSVSVFNFWEAMVAHENKLSNLDKETLVNMITNKKVKKYYNTLYNKQTRAHRFGLMIALHHKNMLDDMIWSWQGYAEGDVTSARPYDYILKFSDDYKDSTDTILSWSGLKNYKKQEFSFDMVISNLDLDDVHNTYYNLVTETMYGHLDAIFITEKTYKAMLLYQPFLIWGCPYSIQTLKAAGYKTFDKWINHSYDLLENHNDRGFAIVDEVKRLNSIPKEEWAEMCFEMLPDLDYNYNHLMNHYDRYTIDENFQINYNNG
jgi:hypothetical protein